VLGQECRLAKALDGYELALVARASGRSEHVGNLLAFELAEGLGSRIVARLAIGRRDRSPATRTRCKASVHAVTVGIVGNDEGVLFRMRYAAKNDAAKYQPANKEPHRCMSLLQIECALIA
jgi:hypothetical protein